MPIVEPRSTRATRDRDPLPFGAERRSLPRFKPGSADAARLKHNNDFARHTREIPPRITPRTRHKKRAPPPSPKPSTIKAQGVSSTRAKPRDNINRSITWRRVKLAPTGRARLRREPSADIRGLARSPPPKRIPEPPTYEPERHAPTMLLNFKSTHEEVREEVPTRTLASNPTTLANR